MNSVMVDNWFIEEVIFNSNNVREFNKEYLDLLEAIVLWEDIYYPDKDNLWWKKCPIVPGTSFIKPIPFREDDLDKKELSETKELYSLTNAFFNNKITDGALQYLQFSATHGFDYLPCSKRKTFLMQCFSQGRIKEKITVLRRLREMEVFDKVIEEYYIDLLQLHETERELFKLPIPVLADYIVHHTPQNMLYTDYAQHLKYEGRVVRYRQYLQKIEDTLEKQNWSEYRKLISLSREAENDVTRFDINVQIPIEYHQMIPIPAAVLAPAISITKNIWSKKTQLTFINDLSKYAKNEMRLY